MKNLLISQKFMFIAVAVSIPIIVLSYFFVAEKNQSIQFTRAELDGTQYLRPLRQLAGDVAAHRDLASAVLAGDASFAAELDKRSAMIDDDFKEIAAQQAKSDLAAPEDLESVRTDWQNLKSKTPTLELDQSFEQHSRYLSKILQFTALIANESNLVLDSDVDSHYLVDALVFKLPKLDVEMSAARAHGAAFYASGAQGEQNSLRRGDLAAASVRINDALYETNHSIRFAAGKAHPRTEEALASAIADASKAVNAFVTTLANRVVNGTGELMPIRDYFAAAGAALDASARLWDTTVAELDRQLGERSMALQKSVELEILAVGLAMLLTVGFLFLVARAFVLPIRHLSEVADRISLGDMDATIDITTRDEIGELGERFRRMQVSLRQAMDALEKQDR
jgi:HAMP domain-containing protein